MISYTQFTIAEKYIYKRVMLCVHDYRLSGSLAAVDFLSAIKHNFWADGSFPESV